MKKIHLLKIVVGLALLSVLPSSVSAKTAYNFLNPVRTEITNQLFLITNTVPVAKSNLVTKAKLIAALKAIDRPSATNLVIDLQSLNLLYVGLSKSSLSNTFLPLLGTSADDYFDLLANSFSDLTNRLAPALPSAIKTATEKNLALILTTLQKAGVTNLANAIKLMSQAAAKVKVTDTLVTKAVAAPPGPNTVTATIGGAAFVVRGLLGPGHIAGALGNYEAATHLLTIAAAKPSGSGLSTSLKTLTIDVGGVVEGTTVHSFANSGSDGIAVYLVGGLHGAGGSTSDSGTITVTMNSAKKVMSGSFSIVVTGTAGSTTGNPISTTITGTFMVNYL